MQVPHNRVRGNHSCSEELKHNYYK